MYYSENAFLNNNAHDEQRHLFLARRDYGAEQTANSSTIILGPAVPCPPTYALDYRYPRTSFSGGHTHTGL